TGYSRRVALLTPTSVACADSTTATSNSNGVVYSSSVVGDGSIPASRANISRTSVADRRLRCGRPAGLRPAGSRGTTNLPAPWPGPAPRRRRAAVRACRQRRWRVDLVARPAPPCGWPGALRVPGSAPVRPRLHAGDAGWPGAAPARRARAPGRRRIPSAPPPAPRRGRRPGSARPAARRRPSRSRNPAAGWGRDSGAPRLDSAPAEFRLALVEEGGGAFAHVVGGKHQAELRRLVGEAFLDAALAAGVDAVDDPAQRQDRKSTRLNSSHVKISY